MNKFLAGLCVALFVTAGIAQAHCGKCGVGDDKPGDMNAMVGQRVEHLTKKLSLTDEQKGKVEGILKEKMEKKHQLMEDNQKSMKALDDEFKTKLTGVLTPEQVKKWEEMKDDLDGHCPKCKDGKMCDICKKKKGKKDLNDHEDHEGHEQHHKDGDK